MSERPRIFVMNDPHAMRINRDLADEIGFQESVIFLQLEYLIVHTKDPSRIAYRDGRWWYRATLKELNEEQFSWWSEATISRVLHRLEERSLIVVNKSNNKVGYDRTQWYAINEEGVRELDSIAIFQNERTILQNEKSILQNEMTIQAELVEEEKETHPNGCAKKAGELSFVPDRNSISDDREGPKPTGGPRKLKASDAESEERWQELLKRDPNSKLLREFATLRASKNQNAQIKLATLWRQIGAQYEKKTSELSAEALGYGLSEALDREITDVRYALACARNYRPEASGRRSTSERRRSGGEVRKEVSANGASGRSSRNITEGYEFLFEDG